MAFIGTDGYLQGKEGGNKFLNTAAAVGAWALPVVPWYLFAWREFGTVLSNTARAKSTFSPDIADMLREFAGSVNILLASDGIALAFILVAVIMAVLLRKRSRELTSAGATHVPELRTLLLISVWTGMVVILYAFQHVLVVSRYLLLVSPFLALIAFIMLIRILNGTRLMRFTRTGVVILAAGMILQSRIIYRRVVAPGITAFENGMETCLIPIGRWLKENTTDKDVILLWDIGAVGYYSDRTICDAAGLATPEMIALAHDDDHLNGIVRKKLYRQICPVTWIVHRAESSEAPRDDPDLRPVLVKPFYRMGLRQFEMRYYTAYRVMQPAPD